MSTQLSENLQKAHASSSTANEPTDLNSMVTQSAAHVMKDLTYTITKINPATATKATSKEVVDTKSNDEQKTKVEIDDDGFKIPQGTQHRLRKKLESAECLMIVQRILDKDLDPSGVLIDVVKVRHKLKSYGLSDREWRCYLLYHQRYATLAPIARKLIMELEPKIIEVELI